MRTVLFFLLLALGALTWPAHAQEDSVVRIEPVVQNQQLLIDADITFTPSAAWRHAMKLGVPAYFTADLELVEPRWWWFDKTIIRTSKTWKVVYNTLTQQWRVGSGELSMPAASLDEALAQVRHIRHWFITDVNRLDTGTQFYGRLRVRLDTSLLAQPLQLNALNRQEWSLSTPWKTFSFSVTAGGSSH